jgi:DNA-binding SARP family transcriptional activator
VRRRVCLEQAVGLCQGPLLPSCYDDWIGPERERLGRRCEGAVAGLVGLLEEQREYVSGIAHVRHWLEHDPLDEEAYRWLMRLHALAGDRTCGRTSGSGTTSPVALPPPKRARRRARA